LRKIDKKTIFGMVFYTCPNIDMKNLIPKKTADIRKNLFVKDFNALKNIIDPVNPFLSVPNLNEDDANKLYNFVTPPAHTPIKGHKTKVIKPIAFVVQVLKNLINDSTLLTDYTQFNAKGNVHKDYREIIHLAQKSLPFFEGLSKQFPTLSLPTFLKELRGHGCYDTDIQVRRAFYGLHVAHPVYTSFLEPYEELISAETRELLAKHAIIRSVVWNAYFFSPFLLSSFFMTMERALRGIYLYYLNELEGLKYCGDFRQFTATLNTFIDKQKFVEHTSLKDIEHFVSKLWKRKNKKSSSGGGGGGKGSKKQNHWIVTDNRATFLEVLEDEEPITLLHKTSLNPFQDIPIQDIIEADLSKYELSDELFIYESVEDQTALPEVQVINLSIKARHVALYNQFFKQTLTPSEISQILNYAQKNSQLKSTSESDLRALVLICISLTTGYNLKQSHRLKVIPDPNQLDPSVPCILRDCSRLWLPIPSYSYITIDINPDLYYKAQNTLPLPLPIVIQEIIKSCLHQYFTKNQESLQSGEVISDNIRQKSLEISIRSMTEKIGLDRRCTLTMIQNHTPSLALKYSNGDLWSVSLLSGREDIMASTHKHYTTIDVSKILNIYRKTLKLNFGDEIPAFKPCNPKKFTSIGNPFRPKKYPITDWLNQTSSYLFEFVHGEPKNFSIEQHIDVYNLLTLYFETVLSLVVATRNATNPYIYKNQLVKNNFVTLNDKNINNGYNTHLVYVPHQVLRLQNHYEHWVKNSIEYFRKRRLIKVADLFNERLKNTHTWKGLLIKTERFHGFVLLKYHRKKPISVMPYTRTQAAEVIPDQFKYPMEQLKPNANRHFLRSSLLERNINPEYIDEYLGHRHYGTETWNPSSFFNPLDYQNSIAKAIERIVLDLKLKSPFDQ